MQIFGQVFLHYDKYFGILYKNDTFWQKTGYRYRNRFGKHRSAALCANNVFLCEKRLRTGGRLYAKVLLDLKGIFVYLL